MTSLKTVGGKKGEENLRWRERSEKWSTRHDLRIGATLRGNAPGIVQLKLNCLLSYCFKHILFASNV